MRSAAQGHRRRLMVVSASALHGSHDPRTIRARRLLEGLTARGFATQLLSIWSDQGPPPVLEGVETIAVPVSDPFAPEGMTLRLKRRLEGDPGGLLPWARDAARQVAALPADQRPELVYAIAYPVDGLIAAALVAKKIGVPWIADLGDPWEPSGLAERLRRRSTLASAAALVTPNAELARSLRSSIAPGAPVLLSPGGGRLSSRSARDGIPLIVHLGSINAGRVDPRPAFEVLGAAHRRAEIEFRSHTNGWHPELDQLPHPHLPMLAPEQALELTAEASAALVLGNKSTIQVPSKAYEIACTETWALCVSELEDDPALEVLSATGHAIGAENDVASVRDALSSLLDKERRGQKPQPAPQHDWSCRIDQIANLIAVITAEHRPVSGLGSRREEG